MVYKQPLTPHNLPRRRVFPENCNYVPLQNAKRGKVQKAPAPMSPRCPIYALSHQESAVRNIPWPHHCPTRSTRPVGPASQQGCAAAWVVTRTRDFFLRDIRTTRGAGTENLRSRSAPTMGNKLGQPNPANSLPVETVCASQKPNVGSPPDFLKCMPRSRVFSFPPRKASVIFLVDVVTYNFDWVKVPQRKARVFFTYRIYYRCNVRSIRIASALVNVLWKPFESHSTLDRTQPPPRASPPPARKNFSVQTSNCKTTPPMWGG